MLPTWDAMLAAQGAASGQLPAAAQMQLQQLHFQQQQIQLHHQLLQHHLQQQLSGDLAMRGTSSSSSTGKGASEGEGGGDLPPPPPLAPSRP